MNLTDENKNEIALAANDAAAWYVKHNQPLNEHFNQAAWDFDAAKMTHFLTNENILEAKRLYIDRLRARANEIAETATDLTKTKSVTLTENMTDLSDVMTFSAFTDDPVPMSPRNLMAKTLAEGKDADGNDLEVKRDDNSE